MPLTDKETLLHKAALAAAEKFRSTQADLLDLVQELERTRLFVKLGVRSCFAYCLTYLNLSEDMTCNLTTVARKSFEVPELKEAVREGLSIAKARKISPVLTPENQEHWISLAKKLTYAELERELAREFPSMNVRESAKPVGDERFKITFGLDGDALELFRRVQDIVSSKKNCAATFEETFVAVMKEYWERHDPLEKASRAKKESPEHEVNQRDQACCQAENPDGTICGATRWLHRHHIVPKSEGGTDDAENLITLCSFHHQLCHQSQNHPPYGGRSEPPEEPRSGEPFS